MKLLHCILAILAFSTTAIQAADDHDHKVVPGPKGGKILEIEPFHAEFFVQPDRKVSIAFYDETMKPVPPGEQVVKVIAEAPSGKTTIEFEKTADAFVSTSPLPEGDGYRVVVQIRPTAGAKQQNFRIEYHTEVCSKCKRAEYACICEESGDHAGHGH